MDLQDKDNATENEDLRTSLERAYNDAQAAEITPKEAVSDTEKPLFEEKTKQPENNDVVTVKEEIKAEVVTEQPIVEVAPPTKAPTSWTATAKAEWEKLPDAIRQEVLRREDEMHKGLTKQDDERLTGKRFNEAINPFLPLINSTGAQPIAVIQDLLQTVYNLKTGTPEQKANTLRQIAQAYDVDVEGLSQPQPYIDPALETLQQRLDRMEQLEQQRAFQYQQSQEQQLSSEIAAFAAKHEHYDKVSPHMAALLSNGIAQTLEDAYNQAIWANPDVRSILTANQQREADEKRKQEIQAKTTAAKMAAGSVTGSPLSGAVTTASPHKDLRSELEANFAAARGGF